jgi:hypothetical protein
LTTTVGLLVVTDVLRKLPEELDHFLATIVWPAIFGFALFFGLPNPVAAVLDGYKDPDLRSVTGFLFV